MRIFLLSLRQLSAALRMLLVFTVVLGVGYPLLILAVGQLPGLADRADGSPLHRDGKTVGSALVGQAFTDADGNPLPQYLQSRPSAGDYDPTATGASNLGPESIVDAKDKPSLLTQVCTRSKDVGELDGVDGSRPYCTSDGVGAVLAVFFADPDYTGRVVRAVSVNQPCPAAPFVRTYRGVSVECAQPGADYAAGKVVPVRGDAPADPVVPADAVTASGSGIDPAISRRYAQLQERRLARVRGITVAQVSEIVEQASSGRGLGFLGEPVVNVVKVNLALDERYPYTGR